MNAFYLQLIFFWTNLFLAAILFAWLTPYVGVNLSKVDMITALGTAAVFELFKVFAGVFIDIPRIYYRAQEIAQQDSEKPTVKQTSYMQNLLLKARDGFILGILGLWFMADVWPKTIALESFWSAVLGAIMLTICYILLTLLVVPPRTYYEFQARGTESTENKED